MAWVAKGYISKQMGFQVDWAGAVVITMVLLTGRLKHDLLKRDLDAEEMAELLSLALHLAVKPCASRRRSTTLTMPMADSILLVLLI